MSTNKPTFANAQAYARRDAAIKRHCAALREHILLAKPDPRVARAFKALAAIATSTAADKPEHASVYDPYYAASTWDNSLTLGLSVYGLESLKGKWLMRSIGKLENLLPWDDTRTADYPGTTPNRDFVWELKLPCPVVPQTHPALRALRKLDAIYEIEQVLSPITMQVRLNAYVRSDSPLCRSVVTGVEEKIERVETRAIVCE